MFSGLTLLMLAFASSSAKQATSTTVTCGWWWTPHKEKCYRIFYESLSWTRASAKCRAESGHLASIPDKETEDFLVGLAKKKSPGISIGLWIGGYRKNGDSEWQWNDGSPWSYTNWARGEPNNTRGREHHLELRWDNPGGVCRKEWHCWNDQHHEKRNNYICQIRGKITTTTTTSTTTSTTTTTTTTSTTNKVVDCGAGWRFHNKKCYRLFPAPLSWTSASAQCEANSGHLATVSDKETETFLVGLAKNFSGSTCLGPLELGSLWLGGYREDGDEEWQWKDGSPWSYTNWPNNGNRGREHHLELRWDTPSWNDEHGHSPNGNTPRHHTKLNGYFCQNGGKEIEMEEKK